MDTSFRSKELRHPAHGVSEAARVPQSGKPRWRLPSWLLALAIFSVTAAVTLIVGNYYLYAPLPAQLLGKWVVTEGEGKGAKLEFLRDGTMRQTLQLGNDMEVVEGMAFVAENNLVARFTQPGTNKAETYHRFLLDLSDHQAVLGDAKGSITILKRAP